MDRPAADRWNRARRRAALTPEQLWLRYFALGGTASASELEAICAGEVWASADTHDRIAHALNERFLELGSDFPLPYSSDPEPS